MEWLAFLSQPKSQQSSEIVHVSTLKERLSGSGDKNFQAIDPSMGPGES